MDRVAHFESLHFGLFIHFGLFSQADAGEWVWFCDEKVRAHYDELFKSFNPKNLDWEKIVGTAKAAGMKYIVLTTRHHDGFSLYDTKGLSTYDVMHTPYGKDIVKEFVDECHKQGMMPMLYHTMHDWQLPLFEQDFKAYLQYLRDSLKVLCTQYGEVGGFWFDGNWSNKTADWEEDALYGMIREYQPNAILINNSGLANRGKRGNPQLDTLTFEQGNLEVQDQSSFDRHLAMEACQTMNHHWGAASKDLDYKAPRQIIEMLSSCRKQGANYLLNIGLTGLGEIPSMSKAYLETIGIWVHSVQAPFEKGIPSSIRAEGKDYVLDLEGKSYVFVHDLPLVGVKNVVEAYEDHEEKNVLHQVKRKIKSIQWMDNEEELLFTQQGEEVSFRAIGFPYGTDLIVRCAVITYEG